MKNCGERLRGADLLGERFFLPLVGEVATRALETRQRRECGRQKVLAGIRKYAERPRVRRSEGRNGAGNARVRLRGKELQIEACDAGGSEHYKIEASPSGRLQMRVYRCVRKIGALPRENVGYCTATKLLVKESPTRGSIPAALSEESNDMLHAKLPSRAVRDADVVLLHAP